MITCDLVYKKIVVLSIDEKVNIILPNKKLIDTIPSDDAIICLPKNIPMIVPPKPYNKDELGGYLLNNEVTTNRLIKDK